MERRRHEGVARPKSASGEAKEPTIADDPTSQAAADWVVRLAGEDAGEADWLAFAAWLDAAPTADPDLHRDAFDRARRVWLLADGLKTIRTERSPAQSKAPARALAWGLAAAAAFAVVVMGLWFSAPPRRRAAPDPQLAVYMTAPGERRLVALSDGTRIEMDGATTVVVGELSPMRRAVTLTQGEAAFDVVHDPSRPFTVDLGAAKVRVLGTAFDVLRDPDLTEVSVARGLVALQTPQREVRLPAGRSATLAQGTVRVRDLAPTDVGAWRTGRRSYWDAPMDVVVADLSRAYPQPVRLGDSAARRLHFTGVLAPGVREETVRRLTVLLPLRATPEPDGAIVLSSASR